MEGEYPWRVFPMEGELLLRMVLPAYPRVGSLPHGLAAVHPGGSFPGIIHQICGGSFPHWDSLIRFRRGGVFLGLL